MECLPGLILSSGIESPNAKRPTARKASAIVNSARQEGEIGETEERKEGVCGGGGGSCLRSRVSFETSFDSKQPKLEPKLVSVLSETKHLFRLFCFYTETESFDVSIEPKQTEDPPKQFKRVYIWVFFRKFRVVLVCFKTVLFVSVFSI